MINLTEIIRVRPRRKFDSRTLRLDMAERQPFFETPVFEDFISNLSQLDFLAYPTADQEDLVKSLLKEYLKVNEVYDLICAAGSDSILKDSIHVFAAASEKKVLLVRPSFPMYEIYCKSFGVDAIVHQMSSAALDCNKFIADITEDVGLIIIANPGSPFGEYLPLSVMEEIIRKAANVGCNVIIDEAYIEFVSEGKRYMLPMQKNVIKIGTLSKAFGGAGARFGWAIASYENIQLLRTVALTYPISSATYKFAEFALKNINQMYEYTTDVRRERQLLTDRLRSSGINILDSEINTVHIESCALSEQMMERFVTANDVLMKQRDTASTPIAIPDSPSSAWYRLSIAPGLTDILFKG